MSPPSQSGYQLFVLGPLRDFRRTWPQLLATDLLARTLAVVVLTPAVALLLKLFLVRTDTGVLSDQDILWFCLHPIGLTALVVVGAVSLGILFFEVGQLMVIGFGALEDRRVTYLDAFRYLVRRAPALLRLAGKALVVLLLIAAPFLAGIGAVYLLMLGKYDINFYLARKPPEFWRALAVAGLLVAGLAILVLRKLAGWFLALPMVLFGGKSGGESLRASNEATAGYRWRIVGWLALWLFVVLVVSLVASQLVGFIGDTLIPRKSGNFTLIAIVLGAVLAVQGLTNLAVTVFAAAMFPLLVVRLYVQRAGPGKLVPEIAPEGSLGAKPSLRIPGKAILAGGAVALVVVGLGAYFIAETFDAEDHAQIIAHRGASGAAPENTIAAFERAIEDGADWIELDVQEDADGTVVVQHDSDFMKQAGVNLKLWNATAEDLQRIDIGSWFDPGFADQRVPTLREVLELAKGHLGVFIELKYYGHDTALESKVVEIVEATGVEASIVVMSLKYEGVQKIKGLRPDWTYGLLSTVSLGDLTRLDLNFLALNGSVATPSLIRHAHKRGMKVYVWTINDPVKMSVLMSRGVDGLITDEPALAQRVKEVRDELSPLGRIVVWIAGETGLLRGSDEESAEEDA
jgi:glycerophosphoryl diester phosphodiesterase